MSLRSGLVLVVETYGTVLTKIISIARFRGMAAFDSIDSAAGDHGSFAIDDEINFLGGLVMMREVRPAGREIHPEKTCYDIGVIDGVARTGFRTSQELIQNRRGMTFDGLFLDVVEIDDLGFGRLLADLDRRFDFETHDQNLQ